MERGIHDLVRDLGQALRERGWRLAVAESCTGGLLAGALTGVAGSSDWFLGGVVAYANNVKTALLGVSPERLAAHGAVSEPVVLDMARGVRGLLGADLSASISGVAGPGGGTLDKPVGTVWVAWDGPAGLFARRFHFSGDRAEVRERSVRAALETLLTLAGPA